MSEIELNSEIETYLNIILSARYGKDMRQAIHDAIKQVYLDGKAGAVDMVARSRLNALVASMAGSPGETVLWEGTAAGRNYRFTLLDDPRNYNYIDVYYTYKSSISGHLYTYPGSVMRFSGADFFNSAAVLVNYANAGSGGLSVTQMAIVRQGMDGMDDYLEYAVTEAHLTSWDGSVSSPAASSDLDADSEIAPSSEYTHGVITKIVGVKYVADAEVADMRIGYDDTEYETAGEAIRAQISAIMEQIGTVETDTTLTQSGVPADAASAGTLIRSRAAIVSYQNGIVTFESAAGGAIAQYQVPDAGVLGNRGDLQTADQSSFTAAINEIVENYAKKAAVDHLANDIDTIRALYQALNTGFQNLSSDANTHANGFVFGEDGLLYLTHNGEIVSAGIKVASSGGGLAFNSGYQDSDGMLHLTLDGEDIEGFDPFLISGGSGGGGASGSRLVFAMYTAAAFSVLSTADSAPVRFKFTSTDTDTDMPTGAGSLAIYVGGILQETMTVAQGDNISIDIRQFLANGTNTVKLVMTDGYGATATRNLTVTVESFSLAWNLGDTEKNTGPLLIYVTPSGSGNKMLYLSLDGTLIEQKQVTTSGRRIEFTIPETSLSVGEHTIEVYGTMTLSGVVLTSDTLTSVIAETSESSTVTVIAAKLIDTEVDQYTTLNIPYRVINPLLNPAEVTFWANGVQVGSDTVDQNEHLWSYRASTPGTVTLNIRSGSASWTKQITVDELSSDITEVTDNLALKVDPNVITDIDTFNYGGTTMSVNADFDNFNGGLQTDEEGVRCIKIMKGDRLTVNYPLFGTDAKQNGRNFKIIYKVENASDFDGTAISCKNGGIGLTVSANGAKMESEQTTLEIPTCEGYKTELELNIEPSDQYHNRIMSFWESGSPAKAAIYAVNDGFRQGTPVGITFGSDTCDVFLYLIRVYTRDLTKNESIANFCADGKDAVEITARFDRNQVYSAGGALDPDLVSALNPYLHVLVWNAENISYGKENKFTGTLTHKYAAGGAAHSWTAEGVENKAQGTSSLNYGDAGYNEDFNLKNGIVLESGETASGYAMTDNSIPVSYFNIKVNVASQEHINNILLSEWYNRYQQFMRTARINNPKVRDTIEGHMAALFFHNTSETDTVQIGPYDVAPGETIFYALGCMNNSKKNNEVFQYDDMVIELRNNISDQVRFKSDDLTGEDWSGDIDFEFRYLNEDVYTVETAQAVFQQFLTFVVSCDPAQATNTAFGTAKVINGQTFTIDSAAYRKAKFKAEAADWMEVDSFIYNYLITLVFSQVDNRAKNVFLAYNRTSGKWNVCFAYDNDTGMGNDNEGGLTLKYGYLDTDAIGTRNVFNAADSALWALYRECYETEIRNMYISLENAGCFNLDAFADLCDTYQNYACEALWIEDAWRKSIDPFTELGTTAYIPMLNGKKRLQRRQFLHYQRAFMGSYFTDSYSVRDTATIRGYTPSSWGGVAPASLMTITPYIDLFVNVMVGAQTYKQRTTAGVPVTLDFGNTVLNDTEMYVRNASFIADLGDLAPLYPGYTDLSPCTRLQRAQIGSSVSGYSNTNMTEVSVRNAKSLEYINVENCPNLAQELDLSNNINVKECLTRGSGVTGVTFADRGRLITARLNALTALYAFRLNAVETFTLEAYDKLTTVNIIGGAINALQLVTNAVNISRVRLKEMVWNTVVSSYKVLMRLYRAQGIDDEGITIGHGVVSGSCHFDAISLTKYNTLVNSLTDMTFTYDSLLEEHTVTFKNEDGTVLYVGKVEHGGTIEDPIEEGYIGTPTKEPDVDYVYTFYKWDLSLENIVADCDRVATYSQVARYNTVDFVDWDGTVLESYNVQAHGSVSYRGPDLTRSGYVWQGWDQDTSDVISDMTVHAVYFYPTLPQASKLDVLDNYDFAYSDDPDDDSAYTAGEFYSVMKMGKTAEYLKVGCKCKMINTWTGISDTYIIFTLHSIGHYRLADGSAMSNADWYMLGVLNANRQMNSSNTNAGGWDSCALRTWMNNTLYPKLPVFWRNLIAQSVTKANAGSQSSNITDSLDYLRIPSYMEVGFGSSTVPYNGEADSEAKEKVFSVYTSNASRIKKTFNNTGTAQGWWLRSADAGSSSYFRYVNTNGTSNSHTASNSYGVCVGFSV